MTDKFYIKVLEHQIEVLKNISEDKDMTIDAMSERISYLESKLDSEERTYSIDGLIGQIGESLKMFRGGDLPVTYVPSDKFKVFLKDNNIKW